MKRTVIGAVASLLLLTAVLPLTGCDKKNKREHEIIAETDRWYSSKVISVIDNCGAKDYQKFIFDDMPVSVVGDLIILEYWAGEDMFMDKHPTCIFDSDGNLLKRFNIEDEIPMSRKLFIAREGTGTVLYYTSENKLMKADFDPSLELQNNRVVDVGEDGVQFIDGSTCDELAFVIGSKAGKHYIYVVKGDDLLYKKEINIIYEVKPQVSPKDGGYQIRVDNLTFFFDPDKLELKSNGSAGMSDYYYSGVRAVTGFDGRLYTMESDGIYADGELFVKYSDSDCNISRFISADLLDVSEDSIALTISSKDHAEYVPEIILLHKEDKNPNAGKTVIRATSYGTGADEMTGEAIKKFNDENKEYFIRYEVGEEEYDEKYEQEFRENIISSDAADIYFGIDSLWWFQKEDYFVDLNKELDLDPNVYYTKITDSIARDGKLFYMPLSFIANGIWTDGDNVRAGAKGFTYDEYREFVKTVGNGADQLSEFNTRDEYFFLCFSMMNDTWFKDGKVNIANESFESMCDYFVNNVPEYPKYDEGDIMYNYYEIENDTAYGEYRFEETEPYYFSFKIGKYKDPVFVGLPTSDGRGPSAQITGSVSISAASDMKDVCVDFVKLLISEDIQSKSFFNPMNRNAMNNLLDKQKDICEEEFERAGFTTPEQGAQYSYYHVTPELKQAYLDGMDKVEVVSATDPAIRAIVLEELKTCYSGQKDIKEIEKTLEDRLNNLYSEKG